MRLCRQQMQNTIELSVEVLMLSHSSPEGAQMLTAVGSMGMVQVDQGTYLNRNRTYTKLLFLP